MFEKLVTFFFVGSLMFLLLSSVLTILAFVTEHTPYGETMEILND